MTHKLLDAACALRDRGFWPLPLEGKRPASSIAKGWQEREIHPEDEPHLFTSKCTGIGIHLGHSGIVDLEADHPAAAHVLDALAPATGMVWRHQLKHRAYRVEDAKHCDWQAPATVVTDRKKASLVEIRAGNHQSAVPPSVHPDTGVAYVWVSDGEPAVATMSELRRVAALAAVAAALSFRWTDSLRHKAALAVAGTLERRGVTEDEALAVMEAVCAVAADGERDNRKQAVRDTYGRDSSNAKTGLPTLAAVLGDDLAEYVHATLADADMESDAGASTDLTPTSPKAPWPEPLAEEALIGLAGDVVRVIGPHTESDPVSLLAQFLVGFGSAIGRQPFARVESDRHYSNEFAVLVGDSSKARKGTSWGYVRRLLAEIDPDWTTPNHIRPGLSSGEGLIWAVRDPIVETSPVKEKGRVVEYPDVIKDKGVEDKRLLIIEEEFASVLKVISREGNTLSAILRSAWNTGDLSTLTKNSAATASGAHISLIGHITVSELRRYMESTEAMNGFGNRILWLCASRSKKLPEGGDVPEGELQALAARLRTAAAFAATVGEMPRDDEARILWHAIYGDLSDARPGLFGALVARAEAHVMRLSCLYALLDCSGVVRLPHLMAAVELWRYCDDSARCIFGDALGDPEADAILEALRRNPAGLTRTEIRDLFKRHKSTANIEAALSLLHSQKKARMTHEKTDGRPVERWFAL